MRRKLSGAGRIMTRKQPAVSPAGRSIVVDRERQEAARVIERAAAERQEMLAVALLASAPKPEPSPTPAPVVEPVVPPVPAPTPAELELARVEQTRTGQVVKDMAVEVLITWDQIKREGEAVRRVHTAGWPADEAKRAVIEFTPTCGARCATHDYPLTYSTDWRAPVCPVCRETTEKE
jgi:hypothetical protein